MNEVERYQEYLCSREWGVLKDLVRERANGICERCGRNPGYAVHHLTYIRKYQEKIEDLALYCEACHEFVHAKTGDDPARPPIDPRVRIDGFVPHLLCPYCGTGGDYLHHNYVVTYHRSEDAAETTVVNVSRGLAVKQQVP